MLSPVHTVKHTSQISPTPMTSVLAMDVDDSPKSLFPKQTNELAKKTNKKNGDDDFSLDTFNIVYFLP